MESLRKFGNLVILRSLRTELGQKEQNVGISETSRQRFPYEKKRLELDFSV
jgi:hypothetical protein